MNGRLNPDKGMDRRTARALVVLMFSLAAWAESVAFAAWLAQSELRDEARKYWKILAVERPADPRLRALADE